MGNLFSVVTWKHWGETSSSDCTRCFFIFILDLVLKLEISVWHDGVTCSKHSKEKELRLLYLNAASEIQDIRVIFVMKWSIIY